MMLLDNLFLYRRLKGKTPLVDLAKTGHSKSEAKAVDAEARERNALSRVAQLENQLEKTERKVAQGQAGLLGNGPQTVEGGACSWCGNVGKKCSGILQEIPRVF